MCRAAEEAISRRANGNDEDLIQAIVPDPDKHLDFVCITPSYLASLPEIVEQSPKLEAAQREKFVLSVLEGSEHLKTVKDKDGKIIIRTEFKRNPRNTLIMHGVAAGVKENDLRELFLSIATAASVSFKEDINSVWLATFDTEANALATHRALVGKKLVVKDSVISIGLRPTRFMHVVPSAAAPQTTGAPAQPAQYNGMRNQGMPQGMRQQYPFQQPYWFTAQQMQQYYFPPYYMQQQQQRAGGQHQPWMVQQQQQKPRPRNNGHQRYNNAAAQQQQQQQQQRVSEPAPAAAAGRADAAVAAAAPAAAATAAATTAPQQPQQQTREGSRQGGRSRGYRGNRSRGGGNRGHGGQGAAASAAASTAGEGAAAEAAAEQHSKHPRQSGGADRQEQAAKPQKKPTADSFPPLA